MNEGLSEPTVSLTQVAVDIASHVRETQKAIRICICGGHETHALSSILSSILGVPDFSLDIFVHRGWTEDPKVNRKRFVKALVSLWEAVPVTKQWIIEHVEAGGDEMRSIFKPTFIVLLNPGADSSSYATGMDNALSKKNFDAAPGTILAQGVNWQLKFLA